MISAKMSVNDMTRIPKVVRQDLNINQGDRIVFEKKGDSWLIHKLVAQSPEIGISVPAWSASKPHSEYKIGDLVKGNDGKIYRLEKIGWQFFSPTTLNGQNSWKVL